MFWNKTREKQTTSVKLEGCLADDKTTLCKHKNHADSCWFCHTGVEPIDNTDEEKTDSFGDSGVFKNA